MNPFRLLIDWIRDVRALSICPVMTPHPVIRGNFRPETNYLLLLTDPPPTELAGKLTHSQRTMAVDPPWPTNKKPGGMAVRR